MSTSEGSRPAKRPRKSSSYPSIETRSAPSSSSSAVTGGGRVQEGTEPRKDCPLTKMRASQLAQIRLKRILMILEAVNALNPDGLPHRPASGKPADVEQIDWICRVSNGPHAGHYCCVCIYICHEYSRPLAEEWLLFALYIQCAGLERRAVKTLVP
ncbi:hypothetical protein FOZ63_033828, partial [Perkinsus olseni]